MTIVEVLALIGLIAVICLLIALASLWVRR